MYPASRSLPLVAPRPTHIRRSETAVGWSWRCTSTASRHTERYSVGGVRGSAPERPACVKRISGHRSPNIRHHRPLGAFAAWQGGLRLLSEVAVQNTPFGKRKPSPRLFFPPH